MELEQEEIDNSMDCEPSALMLPEILENIMKYLPLYDILNCRLVTRKWKTASKLALLEAPKKSVKFTDLPLWDKCMVKLDKFVTLMTSAETIPITHYEFMWCTAKFGDDNILNFFRVCGESVNRLRMKVHLKEEDITHDMMWTLFFLKLPNLENFSMEGDTNNNSPTTCYVPLADMGINNICLPNLKTFTYMGYGWRLCYDILQVTPNLESFTLKSTTHVLLLADCSEEIRKKLTKLVIFEQSLFSDAENFSKLMHAEFQLKCLEVNSCGMLYQLIANQFMTFVRSQTKTLQKLTLPDIINPDYHPYIDLPILPNLKKIKFDTHWNTLRIKSWHKHFPKLKSLQAEKLHYTETFSVRFVKPQDLICPSICVTKLSTPNSVDQLLLLRMSEIFPNVRNLYVSLPDTLLKPFWPLWPRLTKLRLRIRTTTSHEGLYNSGVMGIKYEVYSAMFMQLDGSDTATTGELEDGQLEELITQPSIRDLQGDCIDIFGLTTDDVTTLSKLFGLYGVSFITWYERWSGVRIYH